MRALERELGGERESVGERKRAVKCGRERERVRAKGR